MLPPDLLFLVGVLLLTAWRLLAPGAAPQARAVALIGAGMLAIAQARWCGFTWQDVPAYLLLALVALPRRPSGAFARTGIISVAAASVVVWAIPAVPTLPPPDGPHPLGTRTFRWTDPSRDEPHTPHLADRRSVIVQAWYPTTSLTPSRPPYLDGLGRLPADIGGLPAFLFRRYGQIDVPAAAGAPLARAARPWPVVILSPGYGAPRAVYTGLATQLASRGFVVFTLDHPYEAAVTELPDGQVVGTREILRPGERDHLPYMIREQARRAADIRFVIDRLARRESWPSSARAGRIETSKVAVIGHSFGGAAALLALSDDPRVAAAANIDGTPYGDLPDRRLTRPVLLLGSDRAETRPSRHFLDGNARLLARAAAPAWRYEIARADHLGFTDAPFFLAPPARWLMAMIAGGERGPAATQRVTADLLAAVLAGPLTGARGDLTAAAARHPGVRGGAVTPLRRG